MKNIRIGVIGAECTHAHELARIINIEKLVRGCSVDYLWGETSELAEKIAHEGKVANIVSAPQDMVGKVDAVFINHRHPKFHLPAAMHFVKLSVPMFIDKPLCFGSKEGRTFLKLAKKYNTPVTSFSAVPQQKSYKEFVKQIPSVGDLLCGATYGPCDAQSLYGGVFFYGVHHVEMAIGAFGHNIGAVQAARNGNTTTVTLFYANDFTVNFNMAKTGFGSFAMTAAGTKGFISRELTYDKDYCIAGIKNIAKMFKTRQQPHPYEDILRPVLILEAIDKSLKSGKREKVEKL